MAGERRNATLSGFRASATSRCWNISARDISRFSAPVISRSKSSTRRAIYATSLLTFKLATRVTTRRAAIGAAILYATSSLVFRYHVYERECFIAPLVLIRGDPRARSTSRVAGWHWRIAGLALALAAACLIKLTSLVEVAVIVIFIATVRRRWRDAIIVATRDWRRNDHRDRILLRDVRSRVSIPDFHLPFHEGSRRFAFGDDLSARDPRHSASAVRDRMRRGKARGSHQFRD